MAYSVGILKQLFEKGEGVRKVIRAIVVLALLSIVAGLGYRYITHRIEKEIGRVALDAGLESFQILQNGIEGAQ